MEHDQRRAEGGNQPKDDVKTKNRVGNRCNGSRPFYSGEMRLMKDHVIDERLPDWTGYTFGKRRQGQ
jgi:hypothetical protein